ncbi:MAG: pro-sigmaK processing inhibitor BofA family protein [Peptococcaceae bacterium]|jgi:inhibitor of the pro-sigma K processing machinery|nr:pro-sigmaK processing inhibitor BofA family protein [Peptococcaceae bacterium]
MTVVFLGLLILLVIAVVRSSLRKPNWFLKMLVHVLGGLVGLWLLDVVLSVVGIAVPINVFSVVLAGLLGVPGVGALLVLQLLGV